MKELEERTREWIHRPVFHGAPISWARRYFQGRLLEYRKDHKQFDAFLIEINKLMKADNNEGFANLIKFIDGDSETNWITTGNAIFDAFIKLYNLCLSPNQAFNYIKECLAIYKEMTEKDYELCGNPELLIKRSRWDGNEAIVISFSVKPKLEPLNHNHQYWFDITTELRIIEDHINDIKAHVYEFALKSCDEKLEDALMLFEYYQNKELLRKVFNSGIKELENHGIIKKIGQEDDFGWNIHKYETNLKISNGRNHKHV